MKLTLKRIALRPTYTIGKLYIDGEYFCDTCEDTVRMDGKKIPGETAIPFGTYRVVNKIQKKAAGTVECAIFLRGAHTQRKHSQRFRGLHPCGPKHHQRNGHAITRHNEKTDGNNRTSMQQTHRHH